jgi:hypothetical protein
MQTFKQFLEACWTGYSAKGMKKKGNRMVPNCVPVSEDGMGGGAVASGPTNTAGGGHVDGIGVGPRGEPGVYPKKKKGPVMVSMAKRNLPKA